MSAHIGGTPEEMRALAAKFSQEATQINTIVSTISSQLAGTDWQGNAAQRFTEQWEGQFKSTFTQVAHGLDECAKEITTRADGFAHAGG